MKIFPWLHTLSRDPAEITGEFRFPGGSGWLACAPGYDPASGRVILSFHGRGGTAANNNLTEAGAATAFRRRLAKEGWLIAVPESGSAAWGGRGGFQITLAMLEFLGARMTLPGRLPVLGFSMGGLTALVFAARAPERTARVADVFGIADTERFAEENPCYREALAAAFADPAARREANPACRLDALAEIPIAIFHGTEDAIVPFAQSQRLHEALAPRGRCTLTPAPGYGHENRILEAIGDDIIEFFNPEKT